MKRLNKVALALATAGVLSSGVVQAALFDRGGGLIYDDVLNITWLSDANYAKTSGTDDDGLMNWHEAKAWAAGLSYGGYQDWRLPSALNQDGSGPCYGDNCTNSEMGHLFYIDGGLNPGQSITASATLKNYFTNMQSFAYWASETIVFEWRPWQTYMWYFYNANGSQLHFYADMEFNAWAVRPGDVAAVPEPETYSLLLAGLGLLGFAARRKSKPGILAN